MVSQKGAYHTTRPSPASIDEEMELQRGAVTCLRDSGPELEPVLRSLELFGHATPP